VGVLEQADTQTSTASEIRRFIVKSFREAELVVDAGETPARVLL
jgi:hypothetical protein